MIMTMTNPRPASERPRPAEVTDRAEGEVPSNQTYEHA